MIEQDHASYLLRGLKDHELARLAENNAKFRDVICEELTQRFILAELARRNGTHKTNVLQSTEAVSPEQTEAPSSAEKQTGTQPSASPAEPATLSSLENRSPLELADLASTPEQLGNARAEVVRRLKGDPRKANFLTFRWLLPADEKDKADAFAGLIGCCWRAIKMRLPSGLFPLGYADTKQRDGGIAQETREAITDALVARLHDLRTLSAPEIVLTALNGGFHTDAEVGEALRRGFRQSAVWDGQKQGYSPYLFKYGNDVVGKEEVGKSRFETLTLFDVVPDNPGPRPDRKPGAWAVFSRTNVYNALLKIITQEKAQIVQEFGEKGWTAFEEILELVDNNAVSLTETRNSQNDRDFDRALTVVFEQVYGVKERQARTLKTRFLATVREIVKKVLKKRLGRGDRQKRPAGEYSPPVVPMEVIQRTSGMPVSSRLHWLDDERLAFGGERSSVGRDVPPDERQEIKVRLDESPEAPKSVKRCALPHKPHKSLCPSCGYVILFGYKRNLDILLCEHHREESPIHSMRPVKCLGCDYDWETDEREPACPLCDRPNTVVDRRYYK